MKPFNLEEAKAGKLVCSREGMPARIICFDAKGQFPIIALIEKEGEEQCYTYTNNGQIMDDAKRPWDLMMKTTHKEGYTTMSYDYLDNLKRGCAGRYKMFENRVDLLKYYGEQIPIVKIEWEE